jgi:hypothetical protein
MNAARMVLCASLLLGGCTPSTADRADIERAITTLQSADRVERALGAIAAQHVIKRQSRFNLLDRTELQWWQQELSPAIPMLINMLADDAGLEWIDPNGSTERTTTPRKEAVPALAGLERAAVEPLIAALDRPEVARRADGLLRQINGGQGAADARSSSWRSWWEQHRSEALPEERGRVGKLLLNLLLVLLAVGAVVFGQRMLAARWAQQRLRLKG